MIDDGRSAVVLHEHIGIKVVDIKHDVKNAVGDHEPATYD